MIRPLELAATLPLKGRDSHAEARRRVKKEQKTIETPPMPFETAPVHVRRTHLPPRPSTAMENNRTPRLDGSYALKFSDGTWGHSDVSMKDRPVTRDDIKNLAFKYEKNIGLVAGYKGVELAQRLQAVNDLLLDELISQLRVINLGQAELLERSRESFAKVFQLLDEDSANSRRIIIGLKETTARAEEERTRAIEEAKERIAEVEEESRRQIEAANGKLEQAQMEYDQNMKRYLDQKAQLEEHVKALHHVFLDFQSDAVYLTLEELKTKLTEANTKVEQKSEEVSKLQTAISKWKQQHQDMEATQKELEDVIGKLRIQLKDSQEKNNQLTRQIDLLKMELNDIEESNTRVDLELELPEPESKPLMMNNNPEANTSGLFSSSTKTRVTRRRTSTTPMISPEPWINVYQKIGKIGSVLSQYIETTTNKSVLWGDQVVDKNEKYLLSRDVEKTHFVIDQKLDQVLQITDCLTELEGQEEERENQAAHTNKLPRFQQYFALGITGAPGADASEKKNIYTDVRRIFQAKYLSDKWNRRSNRQLTRFPEFVVMFFYKDDNRIGSALHSCERLWKMCGEVDSTEVCLFRKFLKEEYSLDELTFFLEMRHGLLGIPNVTDKEKPVIKVPYSSCKDLMDRVLGGFSPIASLVSDEAEKKLDKSDMIDYAVFLEIFLKFYSSEREKRKTAIQLMVNSKKYKDDVETPILLEVFIAMLQGLGFKGSLEEMLEFYRQARVFSKGDITLEGMYKAMDDLNIHFYSLDIPLEDDLSFERSEGSRSMVVSHWAKFSQWFDGLRRSATTMDTWVRSQLILQVRRVDQAFQLNLPASTLYSQFRSLLDLFQFFLGLLSRGSPIPMKLEESQKQIELIEQLNDHLLKFVLQTGNKQLQKSR